MSETEEAPRVAYLEDSNYRDPVEPLGEPQVHIVLPAASKAHRSRGMGAKVFICGNEVKRIKKIDYGTEVSADGIIASTVTLCLHEPVQVTFAPEE